MIECIFHHGLRLAA